MLYCKLENSFKIYVFVDSGYNTNHDDTNQLGTIIDQAD